MCSADCSVCHRSRHREEVMAIELRTYRPVAVGYTYWLDLLNIAIAIQAIYILIP